MIFVSWILFLPIEFNHVAVCGIRSYLDDVAIFSINPLHVVYEFIVFWIGTDSLEFLTIYELIDIIDVESELIWVWFFHRLKP